MAPVILSHNGSLQQVADVLGLLVQDGLGGPVALDGLEPLGSLHLPGYDECPSLYTHSLFRMPADVQYSGTHSSEPTKKAVNLLLEDTLKLLL